MNKQNDTEIGPTKEVNKDGYEKQKDYSNVEQSSYKVSIMEKVRVFLRFAYGIIIWYEFLPSIDTFSDDNQQWRTKLPLWISALIIIIVSQIERYFFDGTRPEVGIYSLGFYLHLLIYTLLNNESNIFKLVLHILLDIWTIYTFNIYRKYRLSDMSNLKLGGKYKVGFKRFKSEHGNSCLMFYPCNATEQTVSVKAYDDFDRAKGPMQKVLKLPGFLMGDRKNRVVAQLCPNAQVADDFNNKASIPMVPQTLTPLSSQKGALIPQIFCHGNNVNAEEHFGVPMILASHGFLVVSPTFMDGTAFFSTDKQGIEVPPTKKNPLKPIEQGKFNPNYWNWFKDNCITQRVEEVNKLAEEMMTQNFQTSHFGEGVDIDFDKFIISGQSAGGITAIMAACGDQNHFKMCLTHDPAHLTNRDQVIGDQIDMKVPVFLLQSEGFFTHMCKTVFAYPDGNKEYEQMVQNFKKRGVQQEALRILKSGHSDQGDACVHSEFFTSILQFLLERQPTTKPGGRSAEHYEFLACLWLKFVDKSKFNNGSYEVEPFIDKRIQQFGYAIETIQSY